MSASKDRVDRMLTCPRREQEDARRVDVAASLGVCLLACIEWAKGRSVALRRRIEEIPFPAHSSSSPCSGV